MRSRVRSICKSSFSWGTNYGFDPKESSPSLILIQNPTIKKESSLRSFLSFQRWEGRIGKNWGQVLINKALKNTLGYMVSVIPYSHVLVTYFILFYFILLDLYYLLSYFDQIFCIYLYNNNSVLIFCFCIVTDD